MLTVWLEFAENATVVEIDDEKRKNPGVNLTGKRYELRQALESIHNVIRRSLKRLPTYQVSLVYRAVTVNARVRH